MLFRQLFDADSSTYTYLIAADYGQKAVIIDPVKQRVKQYVTLIKELGLSLAYALDTHLHADHITGIGELAKQLNCCSMMGVQSKARGVGERFVDNQQIIFGDLQLTAIYTPGHTDDSYCFLMEDRVFTGDTLFIRGTGRTDFQNGDAGLAYDSIFQRLFVLPAKTWVYPGHDYQGMSVSTIGEEMQWNPRLQIASREAYIAQMQSLNLAKPKLIEVAVPANQNCGLD